MQTFATPLAADSFHVVASRRFHTDPTKHPVDGKPRAHLGVDLGCHEGVPVHAPCDGVVSHVNEWNGDKEEHPAGNYVVLAVGAAGDAVRFLRFMHLRAPSTLKLKAHVKAGDVLGFTGQTGRTTGPHLHLEARAENWTAVDPETVFPELHALARAAAGQPAEQVSHASSTPADDA